ncbi:EI24 domain-containing protein [Sphingomonas naphthae]|uniref:EI24 domain-containing protein n=1 Tax=Sphingomonas naphthae TaxID=1813468 RepID=A0ABY7TIE8_9SPHN|nr:EI24 domain-containing protein [Sphingomonas naphthae]WCT72756.1 EI24 domain-containing protein [Sphingomonas naphthae]
MIAVAAALSFAQLGDRAIVRILAKSLLLTLALFALLGAGLAYGLRGADPCDWLGFDSCALSGGEGGVVAVFTTLAALWFLFPAVAIGVISVFTDDVVAAVERRHYPAAAVSARPIGWAGGALMGLRSSARLLLYNLIALPFYLVLLVTGVGPLILFLIVNALALGRDLAEMVAARHLKGDARHLWLRRTRGGRAAVGLVATGLFMVPFVNLLAPVIGAAMATHLFHRSRT